MQIDIKSVRIAFEEASLFFQKLKEVYQADVDRIQQEYDFKFEAMREETEKTEKELRRTLKVAESDYQSKIRSLEDRSYKISKKNDEELNRISKQYKDRINKLEKSLDKLEIEFKDLLIRNSKAILNGSRR